MGHFYIYFSGQRSVGQKGGVSAIRKKNNLCFSNDVQIAAAWCVSKASRQRDILLPLTYADLRSETGTNYIKNSIPQVSIICTSPGGFQFSVEVSKLHFDELPYGRNICLQPFYFHITWPHCIHASSKKKLHFTQRAPGKSSKTSQWADGEHIRVNIFCSWWVCHMKPAV